MADLKPELSKKNKYWVEKHRYYELKHFCLQYPDWVKSYNSLNSVTLNSINISESINTNSPSNPTAELAIAKSELLRKINLVKNTAIEADKELSEYILIAVTQGYAYSYLKNVMDIPCCKDTYYDRYRKFFWILSKER